MTEEQFESLVYQAIKKLPQRFKSKLDNVDIVIQNFPNRHQLLSLNLSHPFSLFGIYQGIPITRRTSNYAFVPPDKITLFKKPIEYFFKTPEAIKTKIESVILHEIGHHFGISEQRMKNFPITQ